MSDQPNIVLLMTDQQRADFTAAEGFPIDTMPFVDGMAAEGTRLRQAYTPTPVCVPARCSLLSGRFPKVTEVRQNSTPDAMTRGPDLVDVLREAGYWLNFAGKTHFYRRPEDFDAFSGPYFHLTGPPPEGSTEQELAFEHWLEDFGHEVATEPTPFGLECQFPYRIVSDAIRQIDATPDDRPFFSWVSFPEPHNPYQVPEPYFSLFDEADMPEPVAGPDTARTKGDAYRWLRELAEHKRPGYVEHWRRYRADYCGMLRLIDDQFARYVTHLRERGRADNTVFIILSDHGDYVGEYGLERKGAGVPECLMRVPLIVCGAGVTVRDNATDFVSLVDIMPSLCEAAGVEIPLGVQGRSLWPMLTGEAYPPAEFASVYAEHGFGGLPYAADARPELHYGYEGRAYDELNTVTQSGTTKMLRQGPYKLVYDSVGRGELYDLESDPAELDNLFDRPEWAARRAELIEELLRWTIRTDDDLPRGSYLPRRAAHNWTRDLPPAPERRP